jgi:putative oligomerization/nucleic acid binding protein/phospholipase D-like protein
MHAAGPGSALSMIPTRARIGALEGEKGEPLLLAADYPFLEVIWTMIVIFAWVIWFWLLIRIFADIFRRKDIGGGKKTVWVIFLILVPFVGVFTYLIVNAHHMADRDMAAVQAQRADFDSYVQSVAGSGGATAEIEKAKQLLDSGAITQAEFESIKAKALA